MSVKKYTDAVDAKFLLSGLMVSRVKFSVVWFTFTILIAASMAVCLAKPAQAARVDIRCNNTTGSNQIPGDSTTIENAINKSSTGDEIVFSGTCLISKTIRLVGNRTYRGESRTGTIIKPANSTNLDAIFASSTYLDNVNYTGEPFKLTSLTIDGNGNNSADGVVVMSWQTTLTDLLIKNVGGNGIRLTNRNSSGGAITNTQVNGRIANNFITGTGKNGVYVDDNGNSVTDWILADNWIADSSEDGIRLSNAAGWFIERNHVYGVQKNAIYVDRAFGTTISDNYVESFGRISSGSTAYGIGVTIQGGAATTITGNRVFNFAKDPVASQQYVYIGIVRVNYGTGVVSVIGNVVRGSAEKPTNSTGLSYRKGGGTALVVTSTGNNVVGLNQGLSKEENGVTISAGL